MKKDWRVAFNIRRSADAARQAHLALLSRLRLPGAAWIRRRLGAEYLFSLRSAMEACDRLQELIICGEELRRQDRLPPGEDGEESPGDN